MTRPITYAPIKNPEVFFSGQRRVARILVEAMQDPRFNDGRTMAALATECGVGKPNNLSNLKQYGMGAPVNSMGPESMLTLAKTLGLDDLVPLMIMLLTEDVVGQHFDDLMRDVPDRRELVDVIRNYADTLGNSLPGASPESHEKLVNRRNEAQQALTEWEFAQEA